MDLGLRDKHAIVTGGSLGIGKAIARELARDGAEVAIVVRTKERLDATARELAADTALALGWTVVLARQLPRGPARRPA